MKKWLSAIENTRIGTRLSVGFGLILVVLVGYGLFSQVQKQELSDLTVKLYRHPLTVSNAVLGINTDIVKIHRSMKDIALSQGDAAEIERHLNDIESIEEAVYANFEIIDERFLGDKSMVNEARQAFRDWKPIRQEVITLKRQGFDADAAAITKGKGAAHVASLESKMDALTNFAKGKAASFLENAQATSTRSNIIMWISLALALALGSGVAIFTTRSIRRPLVQLSNVAEQVSQNNYDVHVGATGQDEIGQLGRAFDGMLDTIRASFAKAEEKNLASEQAAARAADERQQYLAASIKKMLRQMERFAEGDLTVSLDVERDDEIGQLFEGFNRAVRNLHQMIVRVSTSVASTAETATEISSASDNLASAAQEQSAQAQEVAAGVEQMVSSISENSQAAAQTAMLSKENGETARTGSDIVRQTVDKIRVIAGVVRGSAENVEQLGSSSQQIGQIVTVIEDIASQTHLLALNANIEAARAGDQGRSFAVVADEVRKLAERTTEATRQIAQMIEELQGQTQRAVEAMNEGMTEVEAGIRLADQTGAALQGIMEGATNTDMMVSQIAAATEEQSATSMQISSSVDAISQVSLQSAERITAIAQAVEGLNQLTEDLGSLVVQFKTTNTQAGYAAPRPAEPSGDGWSASAGHHASRWAA